MIIDFHTHVFPHRIAESAMRKLRSLSKEKAYLNGTIEDLQASMKETGVDLSVILPVVTGLDQFSSLNQYAKEINDQNGDTNTGKCVSFGGIHPDTKDYKKEIDEIVKLGFKGIKLHPDYQKCYIDDIKYLRIIEYASEKGLIITVHAGVDIGLREKVHCSPKRIDKLLRQIKPEKLVIAHMGGNECWDEAEELLIGTGLYFDTGFCIGRMPDEQLIRMSRNHGIDKILFATDSPWSSQKDDIAYLSQMDMKEDEKKAILGENAQRLLFA